MKTLLVGFIIISSTSSFASNNCMKVKAMDRESYNYTLLINGEHLTNDMVKSTSVNHCAVTKTDCYIGTDGGRIDYEPVVFFNSEKALEQAFNDLKEENLCN